MSREPRHRNYCFTLNNYTKEELFKLKESAEIGKYVYICWGYEICPTTKTPHLQGYVENKSARTLSAVKKDPGFGRAHLQERAQRSNKLKAVTYCAKLLGVKAYLYKLETMEDQETLVKEWEDMSVQEQDKFIKKWMRTDIKGWRKLVNNLSMPSDKLFFEAGNWKHGLKPGYRSDINKVRDIVNNGGNIIEIANHADSYQALKFGQTLLSIRNPTRNWKTVVYWVTGAAGKGKTKFCYDNAVGDVWQSSNSLQWFDGYTGQRTVILDDFRPDHCHLSWLLRLTDRYPLNVPIKGGFTDWTPEVIFITSVMSPADCFAQETDRQDLENRQILRRIRKVFYLTDTAPVEIEEVISQDVLDIEEKALLTTGIVVTNGLAQ